MRRDVITSSLNAVSKLSEAGIMGTANANTMEDPSFQNESFACRRTAGSSNTTFILRLAAIRLN